MKNKPLPLTDDEILRLQQIDSKGTDWRSRSRAETLLRLARGESVQAVADALEICKKTVYERRQQWLSKGFAGLLDAPRSDGPRKLSAHLPAIDEWAQTAPLSAGEVHKRLVEEFDVSVHRNTVKNALKRLGFVWKRTRNSLKKP